MRATVLLAVLPAALCACDAAQPVASTSGPICPSSIQPTLSSIDRLLFKVTCTACHTPPVPQGLLDLSGDAYAALVDVPAQNVGASTPPLGLLRVKPGDPDNSLLWRKLVTAGVSPLYGSGMPQNAPGTVCQAATDAVRTWIANGAPND